MITARGYHFGYQGLARRVTLVKPRGPIRPFIAHRERLGAELYLSRLDPGQISQVDDHPAEPIGVVPDPGEIVQRLLGKRAGDAVEEIVHEALVPLTPYLSRLITT